MKIDYTVSDEQLISSGVQPRIIKLSKQPFMRPGGVDFDIPYAMSVWRAIDTVCLYSLAINNPDEKHVYFPPHAPYMGLVR